MVELPDDRVPEISSLWTMRKYSQLLPDSADFADMQSCDICGAVSDWGDVATREAYCQAHAPWIDHELAERVSRAVEPATLAAWLQQRPEGWHAKWDETSNRGNPVLVACLEEVVGRDDLLVNPPLVQVAGFRPVVHLEPWTERFNDMLMHWVVGEPGLPAGAEAAKVLEVLAKAVELEQVAAGGNPFLAKVREAEMAPPWLVATIQATPEYTQTLRAFQKENRGWRKLLRWLTR